MNKDAFLALLSISSVGTVVTGCSMMPNLMAGLVMAMLGGSAAALASIWFTDKVYGL